MYCCENQDGVVGEHHLVHLGARASGGAGLVMAEATAVSAAGRITPWDTGLYNDEQIAAWQRIPTTFVLRVPPPPCSWRTPVARARHIGSAAPDQRHSLTGADKRCPPPTKLSMVS